MPRIIVCPSCGSWIPAVPVTATTSGGERGTILIGSLFHNPGKRTWLEKLLRRPGKQARECLSARLILRNVSENELMPELKSREVS